MVSIHGPLIIRWSQISPRQNKNQQTITTYLPFGNGQLVTFKLSGTSCDADETNKRNDYIFHDVFTSCQFDWVCANTWFAFRFITRLRLLKKAIRSRRVSVHILQFPNELVYYSNLHYVNWLCDRLSSSRTRKHTQMYKVLYILLHDDLFMITDMLCPIDCIW